MIWVTISIFSTVNVFSYVYISTLSPGRTINHPNILNFGGNREGKVKERGSDPAGGGVDLDHQILVDVLCKQEERAELDTRPVGTRRVSRGVGGPPSPGAGAR